ARSLRVEVLDSVRRVRLSTDMVHEGEGEREERWVLGDPVDSSALIDAVRQDTEPRWSVTLPGPDGGVRVHAMRFRLGGAAYTTVLTASLRDVQAVLDQARLAALVAVPIALLLAALGGSVLAGRSLAPVVAMGAQAKRIGATNLHERLPVANATDEVGVLAGIFNALLDRLDRAFDQQRRFMADASHELRTPVAIMRGEAEVALATTDRTPDEYRDALGIVRDAGERLSRTVNDLFLLARVDAGQVPVSPVPIYLDDLVVDCARAMRSLAQQREVELRVSAGSDAPYTGDEELLRRLTTNLLDNAIKYSRPGGTVSLCLLRDQAWFSLKVIDTGIGIPPEAQPFVFDRFFRADTSRTRLGAASNGDGSGTGLGLSIARWIAEVHGGRLELVESSERGTTFELRLPAVPVFREMQPEPAVR
ncbi:MAG TPA: ATP-binding protein, partial [Gemmatimonadaceae bacterium]|nr:ATP-binding protein [Gemmatimonadaceae bacterium]